MFARWARILVACATALVAWLVAAPAYASAPLCDPRGATAIAPAPQLQEPLASIDVGPPADDSCSVTLEAARTLNDGHAPIPAPPDAPSESALLTGGPRVHDTASVSTLADDDDRRGPRAGESQRLDRPPRP